MSVTNKTSVSNLLAPTIKYSSQCFVLMCHERSIFNGNKDNLSVIGVWNDTSQACDAIRSYTLGLYKYLNGLSMARTTVDQFETTEDYVRYVHLHNVELLEMLIEKLNDRSSRHFSFTTIEGDMYEIYLKSGPLFQSPHYRHPYKN